ncbi:sigma-70 family RNA polymerase sigma factor [Paludisphaera sp.]|uniref:sigma-70 family RNA polymerase sigma factor n=1 Tax=Paludisphaera sp. TaxID=2017432 RepID=UPI00301D263C
MSTDSTPTAAADRRRSAPDFPSRCNPTRPTADAEARADIPARCNPSPRPPLTDAQRDLATRYMPLAKSMARRLATVFAFGADDFRAAAALALVEAAQAFDESRGVDFSTFARHRIRGALIDARRNFLCGGWRGDLSLAPRFEPLSPGSESRGQLYGATADEPVGIEMETEEDVAFCLGRLSPRQAAAFRRIYLEGRTQEEAAELDGCSKATMCRLHRDGLERLYEMRGHLLAAG